MDAPDPDVEAVLGVLGIMDVLAFNGIPGAVVADPAREALSRLAAERVRAEQAEAERDGLRRKYGGGWCTKCGQTFDRSCYEISADPEGGSPDG